MRRRVSKSEVSDRQHALAAIASRFQAFRPAREVLTKVRAVPTRFAQFDFATRVGGFPVDRFTMTHGPSNEGKTVFCIGLADSFLARGHLVYWVDAERTTPITWLETFMQERADAPGFFALRPETYEQTMAEVRNGLNALAEQKKKGNLPGHTSALVIVDSLRKLVPANQMAEILKAETEGKNVKGGRDRSAQLKAKMNAAWMDEIVPQLENAGAGFNAIAREMQDPDADDWAKKFGNDYKVGGGGAIFFDSSLACRIERAGWIKEKTRKEAGEGSRDKTFGERHKITIRKTKIAGKEDTVTVCYFHTSNGVLVPPGFDTSRDLLELGEKLEVVQKRGGWLHWHKHRWQGTHAAVRKLTTTPEVLAELDEDVRGAMKDRAPQEYNPITGVVESG